MQTLTLVDNQRLHQSIQQIYTLHNPQTFGLDAMVIVNQLVLAAPMIFCLPEVHSGGLLQYSPSGVDRVGNLLSRSRHNLTERDRLLLNLLRPHLAQAYTNAQRYQRIEQQFAQLEQLRRTQEQFCWQSHSLVALGLSQRETELLDRLIQGKDTAAIAESMGITKSTVRKHLENLYRKFGVTSRTGAIAHALGQLGLLNPPV